MRIANNLNRQISNVLLIVLTTCSCLIFSGCGKQSPQDKQAKGAIRDLVPSGWTITDVSIAKFTPGSEDGTLLATFRAEIAPEETMGLQIDEVEGMRIVREVMAKSEVIAILGKVTVKSYADVWQASATIESELPPFAHGLDEIKPLSTFAPFLVEGSKEVAELRGLKESRQREKRERQHQAELARIEAESKVRIAEEMAAAEERIQKQRIAAQEQTKRELLQKERTLAAMQQRLEAIQNEYGLLLMQGEIEEHWGMVLSVTESDPERFVFSGTAIDYAALPPASVEFSGQIREDGRLLVTFQDRTEFVTLDDFHETGNFSFTKEPGVSLRRMSAAQRKAFDERGDGIYHLIDGPRPGFISHLHQTHQAFRDFQPIGAEMRVNDSPATAGQALTWIDGNINTGWAAVQSTVAVRYRQPHKAIGILLVCGRGTSRQNAMSGGTLIVNGHTRVALPKVQSSSVIEIAFDLPVNVYELRFEAPSDRINLNQIILLEDKSDSKETLHASKIVDETRPGIMSHLHETHEATRNFRPIGADVRVNGAPATAGQALTWIDGNINTGWAAVQSTVAVRYRQPHEAIGILLVCGSGTSRQNAMSGGTLIVNGHTRVALPQVIGSSVSGVRPRGATGGDSRIVEISFDVPINVYELRFEAPSDRINLNQIILLEDKSDSKEIVPSHGPTIEQPVNEEIKMEPEDEEKKEDNVIDIGDILRRLF